MRKLADIQLFEGEGFKGFGPLGLENKSAGDAPSIFAQFISTIIGVISVIAIIWFIFVLITGAVSFITSGGDKQAVEGAKKRIVSGVIGLVLTISALFIVKLIGYLVGLENILNFQEFINLLSQ